jgi:prepilin-type N-terminal cleavage/methylation domain-containing protein/prepilin-type processing-associated H-X9-DG protein
MTSRRDGWTLAELLVVIAILGVLAGLILPAAGSVLRFARRTACASNLRQVGWCAMTYAEDWAGLLPAEGNLGVFDRNRSPAWFDRLPTYLDEDRVKARGVFQCAAYRGTNPLVFSFATPKSLKMNSYLDAKGRARHYRLGSNRGEAGIVLFVDAVAGETGMGQWGHCPASAVTDQRHRGAVNLLALDGHTQAVAATPADGDWAEALNWLPAGWAGGP